MFKVDDSANTVAVEDDEDKYGSRRRETAPFRLSPWSAVAILGYALAIFMFVIFMDSRLPRALTKEDAKLQPEAFIEERARSYLKQLTSVGARVAGKQTSPLVGVLVRNVH
jgi:hypothetical protein